MAEAKSQQFWVETPRRSHSSTLPCSSHCAALPPVHNTFWPLACSLHSLSHITSSEELVSALKTKATDNDTVPFCVGANML